MSACFAIPSPSTKDESTVSANALTPINGPFIIAVDLTCFLYGCYMSQIVTYFSLYSHRDTWLRYLAIVVTLVSSMALGFTVASQYTVLVNNAGSLTIWTSSPWQFLVPLTTTGINALLVQLFFAFRIARFQRSVVGRTLAAFIGLLAVLSFAGSLANTSIFVKNGRNALELLEDLPLTVARVWSFSSVICDVLIATTMSILLFRSREQTHFKTTKHMITRLIIQSIETGTVTALVMILMVICYETMGAKNLVYVVWELSVGPLYGNVLLFVLNARQSMAPDAIKCDTTMELESNLVFLASHDGLYRSRNDSKFRTGTSRRAAVELAVGVTRRVTS
ncbi:hypothetical protein EV122DRAFT_274179 [Schizophyllum commune]